MCQFKQLIWIRLFYKNSGILYKNIVYFQRNIFKIDQMWIIYFKYCQVLKHNKVDGQNLTQDYLHILNDGVAVLVFQFKRPLKFEMETNLDIVHHHVRLRNWQHNHDYLEHSSKFLNHLWINHIICVMTRFLNGEIMRDNRCTEITSLTPIQSQIHRQSERKVKFNSERLHGVAEGKTADRLMQRWRRKWKFHIAIWMHKVQSDINLEHERTTTQMQFSSPPWCYYTDAYLINALLSYELYLVIFYHIINLLQTVISVLFEKNIK